MAGCGEQVALHGGLARQAPVHVGGGCVGAGKPVAHATGPHYGPLMRPPDGALVPAVFVVVSGIALKTVKAVYKCSSACKQNIKAVIFCFLKGAFSLSF